MKLEPPQARPKLWLSGQARLEQHYTFPRTPQGLLQDPLETQVSSIDAEN